MLLFPIIFAEKMKGKEPSTGSDKPPEHIVVENWRADERKNIFQKARGNPRV